MPVDSLVSRVGKMITPYFCPVMTSPGCRWSINFTSWDTLYTDVVHLLHLCYWRRVCYLAVC